MDKREETEEEQRRREYWEQRAREEAALGAKLRKLRKLPRYVLVRRVVAKWGTFKKEFSASEDYRMTPKALANKALRSLLARGRACNPIY
jgi:hypothetical protein